MPELPEVETVARQLHAVIAKRKLRGVSVFDSKLNGRKLKMLAGYKILAVKRSGKQVLLQLQGAERNALFLAVHLRMSGRLIWCRGKVSAGAGTQSRVFGTLVENGGYDVGSARHVRAALYFEGGVLAFVDPRRFGTMKLSGLESDFAPAGVEPFSKEFNLDFLHSSLKKSSQPLKHWLLRQDRIVGLGNIYASEILHQSGLSPLRKANSLSKEESKRLYHKTAQILRKAIKYCGTTFSDFQDSRGVSGSYQKYLKVYDREGENCFSCGTAVQRIVQQGRSTFYCSGCQH